jgi:hypothetical protein
VGIGEVPPARIRGATLARTGRKRNAELLMALGERGHERKAWGLQDRAAGYL